MLMSPNSITCDLLVSFLTRVNCSASVSEPSEPCCPADGLDKMPTRPEVWPAADCGVRLQWEDPSNGWESLKYEVQWRKCGEEKWPPKDVIETSKAELTIDGLSPTAHYLFRVRALVSTRSQQTKWTEWGPSSAA